MELWDVVGSKACMQLRRYVSHTCCCLPSAHRTLIFLTSQAQTAAVHHTSCRTASCFPSFRCGLPYRAGPPSPFFLARTACCSVMQDHTLLSSLYEAQTAAKFFKGSPKQLHSLESLKLEGHNNQPSGGSKTAEIKGTNLNARGAWL